MFNSNQNFCQKRKISTKKSLKRCENLKNDAKFKKSVIMMQITRIALIDAKNLSKRDAKFSQLIDAKIEVEKDAKIKI